MTFYLIFEFYTFNILTENDAKIINKSLQYKVLLMFRS